MKGQKEKDKAKHETIILQCKTGKEQHDTTYATDTKNIKFTYLDLVPVNFNKENVMLYLVNSRWIESMIIMKLGDLCPYLDDYILEIYLMVFEKLDRLIEIYERAGVGAFIGYVKMMVLTNTYSSSGVPYKKIRDFSENRTVYSDHMWSLIQDKWDGGIYKMNNTYDE